MSTLRVISARAWLDRLARSRHALALLFGLSMLETLILPVPLELVLIPWMLCHPDRRWLIAAVALGGNLAASLLGYYLGFFLMEQWGPDLIALFSDQASYESLNDKLQENGFVTLLTIGITPIPFQLAMLAAGASEYPVWLFGLAALLARSVRYFGLALLTGLIGRDTLKAWKQYALPAGIMLLVLGAAGLWMQWSG